MRDIRKIVISPNNIHLNNSSGEFLHGCGISALGQRINDHSFLVNESVEVIPDNEFSGSRWLEDISFAPCSNLRIIGESAFAGSHLRCIEIPQSVRFLGASCFANCAELFVVHFPDNSSLSTSRYPL